MGDSSAGGGLPSRGNSMCKGPVLCCKCRMAVVGAPGRVLRARWSFLTFPGPRRGHLVCGCHMVSHVLGQGIYSHRERSCHFFDFLSAQGCMVEFQLTFTE